jgi:hypothetical protein
MSIEVKYFDGDLAVHNCGTPHTVMQAIMTIDEQIAELKQAREKVVKWLAPKVLAMGLPDNKYLVGKLCAKHSDATQRTGLNTIRLIGAKPRKSTPDFVGDGFIADLLTRNIINDAEYKKCWATTPVSAKFVVSRPRA